MRRLKFARHARTDWVIAGTALAALAAWPAFARLGPGSATNADPVALLTPAPVKSDYTYRDQTIAFYESHYKRNAEDMLIPRLLSAEYLQRYRERADVGDVLRARAAARQSLIAQPNFNVAGQLALASANLALHRFRDAKSEIAEAERIEPSNVELTLSEASVDMELGDYDAAKDIIDVASAKGKAGDAVAEVTISRYDEITGHLADARALLDRALRFSDSLYDMPAERRAWYHFRSGELAYLDGDNTAAIAHERAALTIFPNDVFAWGALARFELATKDYAAARDAAQHGVDLMPSPETLGILADSARALGDPLAASAARAQIDAEEQIGNAQHVNDRLIAVYLADHGLRPRDALAIARREIHVRDDVYAEDTLAWCAAAAGVWDVARGAMAKAIRYDTEDPRIQYHAGTIALHDGKITEAKRYFTRALALNPAFSATQADDARAKLASLR